MITHYINLLGNRDYAQLLRRSRLKEDQLREVLGVITSLNPHPGDSLDRSEFERLLLGHGCEGRQQKQRDKGAEGAAGSHEYSGGREVDTVDRKVSDARRKGKPNRCAAARARLLPGRC